MGMFDFLFDKQKAQSKQIEKLRKKLTNIWLQNPDRNYAAEQLRDIGTPEAITALLGRFKVNVKNTTFDNEEKLYVYDMLVAKGADVIEVIQEHVRNEPNQVNWPMKVLDDLMQGEEMAVFIQDILSGMDVDYERDPEKKEQLILRAQDFAQHTELIIEVSRFTVDDNEPIRFLAVDHCLKRDDDWAIEALRQNLTLEDSVRILNQVCERFVEKKWVAFDGDDEEIRLRIAERLPREYFLDDENLIQLK